MTASRQSPLWIGSDEQLVTMTSSVTFAFTLSHAGHGCRADGAGCDGERHCPAVSPPG